MIYHRTCLEMCEVWGKLDNIQVLFCTLGHIKFSKKNKFTVPSLPCRGPKSMKLLEQVWEVENLGCAEFQDN